MVVEVVRVVVPACGGRHPLGEVREGDLGAEPTPHGVGVLGPGLGQFGPHRTGRAAVERLAEVGTEPDDEPFCVVGGAGRVHQRRGRGLQVRRGQ